MKKSKFLKKSLSLLIAILLVVAMVPVSASAGALPLLDEFRAGSNPEAVADITGDTVSVTVSPTENLKALVVKYTAKNGNGNLFYGNNKTQIPAGVGTAIDVSGFPNSNGVITIPLYLVDPLDTENVHEYTLKIQNTEVDPNTELEKFEIEGQLNSTFEPGKKEFEVIVPNDFDFTPANVSAYIVTKNPKATYDFDAEYVGAIPSPSTGNVVMSKFTVKDEVGHSETIYEITIRNVKAAESFTIPGQIGSTGPATNGPQAPKVTALNNLYSATGSIVIEMPEDASNGKYAGDTDYKVKPEFTSELDSVKVEISEDGTTFKKFVSGETEIDLMKYINNSSALLRVYYPETGTKYVDYTISITDNGPAALIDSFEVVDSKNANIAVAGEINGDQMTVTLPENMDLKKVNMNFVVSANADIKVSGNSIIGGPATSGFEYVAADTATLGTTVDISSKKISLTVDNGSVTKTYQLTVKTQKVDNLEAKFSSMYIKDPDTGKEYKADETALKGAMIKFKIPKGVTATDLADWKIFYTAPAGAAIAYRTAPNTYTGKMPLTGKKVGNVSTYGVLPNPHANPAEETEIKVDVFEPGRANPVDSTKYIVKIEQEDWKTGKTLKDNDIKITTAAGITDGVADSSNTYEGKIKSQVIPSIGPTSVSTIQIRVPLEVAQNRFDRNPDLFETLALTDLVVPEGAAIYMDDIYSGGGTPGDDLIRIYDYEDGKWKKTNHAFDGNDYFGIDSGALGDRAFYVLSEKAVFDLDRNTAYGPEGTIRGINILDGNGLLDRTNTNVDVVANLGNIAEYFIDFSQMPFVNTTKLDEISLVNRDGDYEVKGKINGAVIEFEVPYSWARSTASGAVLGNADDDLFLKYSGNTRNFMRLILGAASSNIVSGGWLDAEGNQLARSFNNNPIQIKPDGTMVHICYIPSALSVQATNVDSLQLNSENETTSRLNFSYKIKIKDIQGESSFKSFELSGSKGVINGREINVELPYKSNLKALAAVFEVSEMAKVTLEPSGEKVISGKTKLDYSGTPIRFKVTSESGAASTIYTLNISTPLKFSDVTGDWYYDYVMEAAKLGIVGGMGDGTFRPTANIKRGDFVLMLARAYGEDEETLRDNYEDDPYRDVNIATYYGPAIAWAQDKQFINGYADSTFNPEAFITRQEVAAILYRALNLSPVTPSKLYADDHSIADWSRDYIYAMQDVKIFEGDNHNKFNPQNNITRAETAKVMVQYTKVK